MIDRAVVDGSIENAMDLADIVLSQGSSDFLIKNKIDLCEDKSITWVFVRR